jgi:hypothetical protein
VSQESTFGINYMPVKYQGNRKSQIEPLGGRAGISGADAEVVPLGAE